MSPLPSGATWKDGDQSERRVPPTFSKRVRYQLLTVPFGSNPV